MTTFPIILSATTDAAVAFQRIGAFLIAEELDEPYAIDDDPSNKWAIRLRGTFEWDKVEKLTAGKYGRIGGKTAREQPRQDTVQDAGGSKSRGEEGSSA